MFSTALAGTFAVASRSCARRSNGAAPRISTRAVPASMRSRRGPLIIYLPMSNEPVRAGFPQEAQLRRAFAKATRRCASRQQAGARIAEEFGDFGALACRLRDGLGHARARAGHPRRGLSDRRQAGGAGPIGALDHRGLT